TATAIWDKLVSQYVKPSGVDYQGLTTQEENLTRFIAAHEKLTVDKLSDEEKKAVYINLYNAGMMYNLLKYAKSQKIDVKSKAFTEIRINDISVPGGNIWNGSYKFKLQGHEVTLDNIEHGLLRREASGPL